MVKTTIQNLYYLERSIRIQASCLGEELQMVFSKENEVTTSLFIDILHKELFGAGVFQVQLKSKTITFECDIHVVM